MGGNGDDTPAASLYETALEEITAIQEQFPVPIENIVPHVLALLLQEEAVLKGEGRNAHELGLLLRGLSSLPTTTTTAAASSTEHPATTGGAQGVEAYVESLLQWTSSLSASGRRSECVKATERLASFCERQNLPWHYMRSLIQLSTAHLQACPADPAAPLPPLLRCLTLCEALETDALHALASLVLAQVQLRLSATGKARALIQAALPTLLEHAPVREQGDAWLTLAKCHLQEVGMLLCMVILRH